MLNRPNGSNDTGEVVASMRDYESAQKTVSKLIAAEVPAREIAIIGQSVRTVERVTGRLGYAAAARSGAINGVLIGLFLSAILVLGNPDAPMQLFVGFVFIGVALGMLLSLVTYAIVRRRRDFASVTQFAADHYEVTVQPASLAKARQVLGAVRQTTVSRPPVNLDEPPKYGERIPSGGPAQATPATTPATSAEQATAEQAPVERAPVEQSPADSAPAESDTEDAAAQSPAEQAPAEPTIPPRPADPVPRGPAGDDESPR